MRFDDQLLIIMEGPDGCGKTNIGMALSDKLSVPYFKITTERNNWMHGRFREALEFDQVWSSQYFEQTGASAILDRMYPSEFSYSQVFGRQTNFLALRTVDETFSRCKSVIIVCRRRDYSVVKDDLPIKQMHLELLDEEYERFCKWTKCNTINIFVDEFDNDIEKELNYLYPLILKGVM